MKRISFFLLAILFITLIHPPIVIALELAETSETTTDESEASPTEENAEVGSTEDALSKNEMNQSETPNEPYEPIKPFNGYETETIWGNYRNDSRFSIDLVKVTHHSIDANYRVKHEGPNFGENLPINLQYGYLIPSIFGDPFAFQTRLGSGDFFRNYVVTDLPPASPIFLTLSTPRIDNEGMIYVAGARQLVITAGNPSIGSTELKEISTNKATISQSLNTARNNSDYRPVKFEVRISNQNNWTQQTLTYTNGLELFSETASQFTTQFELPNLMANTEYSVTTRLTTGDSFSTANQLTSEWSTPIIIKTDQVTSTDLEVIAKPADVLLGTPVESLDPNSLVEVKLDGVTLPASEYTCVLSNIPSIETRTTGNTIAQVRVTRRGQSKTASVPLTVKWGSTIQHNGTFQTADMKDQERIIGTYTWHQGLGIRYSPFTLSAGGQYPLSEAGIGNTVEITSLSVFSGAQDFRLGSANATSTFVTRGNSLSYNLESSYNAAYPSGFIPATVGDVVESRHIYGNNQVLGASTISNRIWQGLRTETGFTDPTGGLNSTYYEITAAGFRPLVVNQTRGIDTELAAGTTRAQLDARINNFVDLPQGVQVKGFETYPDLENTGTSTGRILVEETLQSGKKVQIVVSVNFERLPDVTISAKPSDILLGIPVGSIDPKDLVEVKQDGGTVPKSDYASTLTNSSGIETRTIGNQTAQVRVTYDGKTETLSVPLTVKWGSTIQHNGTYDNAAMKDQERIIGTYTWHPGLGIRYSPFTLSAGGQFPLYEAGIGNTVEITSLSVFSGAQDFRLGSANATSTFVTRGNSFSYNLESSYNAAYPSGFIPATVGDVVESRHIYRNNQVLGASTISNRIWQGLRTDAGFTDPTGGLNSTYYEIMADGFRPLVVNQAKGIDTELEAGTTRAQLDARINSFVDLPQGVQAKSFETYPDLENTGTSTGRIVVEETLQSGKKVQSAVSVNFERLPAITFSAKPTDVLLGTSVGSIDPKDLVEVKQDGVTVPKSDYTSTLTNAANISTRTVGNLTAQVRVTHNGQTETLSVPLTVKWGSSIQLYGSSSNMLPTEERVVGVYTWHPSKSGISYVAGETNLLNHRPFYHQVSDNNLASKLSVYSGTQDIKIGSSATVREFSMDNMEAVSNAINRYAATYPNLMPVSIGDVVESHHRFKNNEVFTGQHSSLSNRIWQGLRTDAGFTDPTGGLNSTYYEITAAGFRPLVVNQATGISTELEAGTTRSQLDARINDFVELPQGVQAKSFETYPDLENTGTSTGRIVVEETLQSGKKIQSVVSVNFERMPAVTISAKPTDILLGTPAGLIDPKDLVEVKRDGVIVPVSEYTCVLTNAYFVETRTVGNTTAQVQVTYDGQSEIILVPLTVKWGSSIQLFGSLNGITATQERAFGAYTWHLGKGISFAPGTLELLGTTFIPQRDAFFSETTSRISLYSGVSDVVIGEAPAERLSISPYMTPSNMIRHYNSEFVANGGFMPANVGDVVEIYHIYRNLEIFSGNLSDLSNRIWQGVRTDDGFTDPTGGLNNVYYEIMADGFRPLVVNQATGIDTELEAGTTRAQLDARINDFVDLPQGVQAKSFETYPDLENTGTSTGRIVVEETLQSGKKIQTVVSVNFERLPAATISAKPTDILLGTPVGSIDPKDLVEVKRDGVTVPKSDYTSTLTNAANISTQTVGNLTAQVRVTYNGQTETLSVPLTVKWGSSIQLYGSLNNMLPTEERVVGAYTWHPSKSGISYVAGVTGLLNHRPFYHQFSDIDLASKLSVYSGTQDIKIGSSAIVREFSMDNMEAVSNAINRYAATYPNLMPVSIGDVVESYHRFKNNEVFTGYHSSLSNRIWQGLRANEELTNPARNINSIFYEMTAEGFRPLVVNQARGIDTELEAGTTYTQLDARINDFVELPQGVQAIRFETYPNLDSGGISRGQILVEETLQSGRKIQSIVPVDFDVTPVMISVKLPVSMLFHTDNVKGANVPITSQSYRIQNDSDIPVGISRTDIVNAQNYSNIHKLNFTSTDVQGSAWENIITNGVLNPSDSQQVRLEVGQTTNWSFSGTATVTEEINPYLEMVFTVSAIN